MSKNKLQKFAEMAGFPNVFQNFNFKQPQLIGANHQKVEMVGQWGAKHFGNKQPITLELACGRGEYTVALAERYPDRNYIGVDIKGARIHKGAKYALEKELTNTAFLRTRIELIDQFFAEGEIDEIWITFPDPFLRESKANRRLSHPFFIEKYRKFLKKGGQIHLKTDSLPLYEFTLEIVPDVPGLKILERCSDIYGSDKLAKDLDIKTYYENMHLNRDLKITYLRLQLD